MALAAHPAELLFPSDEIAERPERRRGRAASLATRLLERGIDLAARAGSAHPGANPAVYGVKATRDLAYKPGGHPRHRLDVYEPTTGGGPRPVVLYVHGGGFRLLSKDTHWMAAIALARRGYVVFNISYRLAPENPFPAAFEDVADAYLWMLANAARFGGDLGRIAVAGESAGANLVTSLAIAASYRRPERWAQRVFAANRPPRVVVAGCGIFEVSGAERLVADSILPRFATDWVLDVRDGYLGHGDGVARPGQELADPLRLLERGEQPERPLPAFFASVGSADPLVEDSLRLERALDRLGVANDVRVYEGEVHAFQLLTWRAASKAAWRDAHAFLSEHLPAPRHAAHAPARARRWSLGDRVRERIIDRLAA